MQRWVRLAAVLLVTCVLVGPVGAMTIGDQVVLAAEPRLIQPVQDTGVSFAARIKQRIARLCLARAQVFLEACLEYAGEGEDADPEVLALCLELHAVAVERCNAILTPPAD